MLARKIQSYGNNSLGITLPKQYLRALGIKKGDSVGIDVLSDGSLRVLLCQDNQNGAGAANSRAPPRRSEASSNSDPEFSTSDLTKEGTSDE